MDRLVDGEVLGAAEADVAVRTELRQRRTQMQGLDRRDLDVAGVLAKTRVIAGIRAVVRLRCAFRGDSGAEQLPGRRPCRARAEAIAIEIVGAKDRFVG